MKRSKSIQHRGRKIPTTQSSICGGDRLRSGVTRKTGTPGRGAPNTSKTTPSVRSISSYYTRTWLMAQTPPPRTAEWWCPNPLDLNRHSRYSRRVQPHPASLPRIVLLAEHYAHEVDRVLRTEFAHDVFAVKLDGARADAKRACSFLAGGSPHDLSQRRAFPWCQ